MKTRRLIAQTTLRTVADRTRSMFHYYYHYTAAAAVKKKQIPQSCPLHREVRERVRTHESYNAAVKIAVVVAVVVVVVAAVAAAAVAAAAAAAAAAVVNSGSRWLAQDGRNRRQPNGTWRCIVMRDLEDQKTDCTDNPQDSSRQNQMDVLVLLSLYFFFFFFFFFFSYYYFSSSRRRRSNSSCGSAEK